MEITGGIRELWRSFRLGMRKQRWVRLHPESDTIPMNCFDFDRVQAGRGAYGELNIVEFGGDNKVILGPFVSVGQQVIFLLNAEHHLDTVSTYPFKVKTLKIQNEESFAKGDIVLEPDSWIGYGSTILSGVRIGQGAVIAAGSIVTKDIPPYAVAGGAPAKVIRYRFPEDVIHYLLTLDYEKLTEDQIREHLDILYRKIDNLPLETIQQMFSWFPKKEEEQAL